MVAKYASDYIATLDPGNGQITYTYSPASTTVSSPTTTYSLKDKSATILTSQHWATWSQSNDNDEDEIPLVNVNPADYGLEVVEGDLVELVSRSGALQPVCGVFHRMVAPDGADDRIGIILDVSKSRVYWLNEWALTE